MINTKEAKDILKTMLFIRYSEEKIAHEYRKGFMKCPIHLYIGQEAISTGVCLNVSQKDYLTSNHRSHGHYFAKGGKLISLLQEICGLPSGCSKGWGGSQHLYGQEIGILGTSAIVGSNIAIGTGIALAIKMKKQKLVSVVFFGDGATEEGYFYESLNYASLKKLPVLYICENNFLATHSRIENRRPPGVKLFKIAESLGVKSIKVDGNNVVTIYEKVKNIINNMRTIQEPYFIEATTYRWNGHVSTHEDYGARYRTKEEVEKWKKNCPIKKFILFATKNSLITPRDIEKIRKTIFSQIDKEFENLHKTLVYNKESKLVPTTPY